MTTLTPLPAVLVPPQVADLNWFGRDPGYRPSIRGGGADRTRLTTHRQGLTSEAYTFSAYRDLLKGHLIDVYA